jgi:hypothetical protein
MSEYKLKINFFPVRFTITKGGQVEYHQIPIPPNVERIVGIGIDEKLVNQPFVHNIRRYGVGLPGENAASFALALTKEYMATSGDTFTVEANAGEKVYYAQPKRLGSVRFEYGDSVGGFIGPTVISLTDEATGVTEDYSLYESTVDNLGVVTVQVIQLGR